MTTVSDARAMNYFSSVWSNRFIIAAIVQGAVITGFTLAFVAAQIITSGTNIIEFLSLSFEGPAKWFFLGYIFYMILVVAIAVTAVFYNHLEVGMGRRIKGFRSALAWIHLVGMNVGGAATTITMIFAGLAGSGILSFTLGGTGSLQPNTAIMDQFVPLIAAFTGLLSIGLLAGGLAYIATYLQESTPAILKSVAKVEPGTGWTRIHGNKKSSGEAK